MISWLISIFSWLWDRAEPWMDGVLTFLRSWRWVIIAIIGAILGPVAGVLASLVSLVDYIESTTGGLSSMIAQLDPGSASGLWASVAHGAALANCLVPLDYFLSTAAICMSYIALIGGIKLAVWVYRLLPLKAT